MDRKDIVKKLKELKSKRGILGQIEWQIGIPKNNLSGYISGSKEIPEKWVKPLSDYLENGVHLQKTIELPKDFIGVEKIAILRADGTMEEIKTIDQLPLEWANMFKSDPTNGIKVKFRDEGLTPITKEHSEKNPEQAKFKTYDYSAMPEGLRYEAQQKWKAQARIEQNKQ